MKKILEDTRLLSRQLVATLKTIVGKEYHDPKLGFQECNVRVDGSRSILNSVQNTAASSRELVAK